MKKIILVILLLLIVSFGFAQTHRITSHTVNIQVNDSGLAQITERFYLYFPTEQDKIEFRNISTDLGYDLVNWENFDPKFTTTVGSNNLTNGTLSYNEGESNFLEIKYELLDALMEKGQETNMVVEYSMKASYFNKLFEPPFWVIPDNTDITIELPPGASIKGTVEPEAKITNSGTKPLITWKGYKSGAQLNVDYVLWKKADPVVDINAISNFLFKTTEGIITIVVGLLILLILLWKRKRIINKIERFVENHTIIEES
ncbi:MAG: hypothetical protein HON47_04215 [Candidatus Diapherotrites archaeon]|jgi:hypothetical protein|uniref:Uncharacterized protein n=1 Tax=Candidatus Iainarchaeum sp. TaxID=3101447 RepID=A0A8T5GFG8_9ARCH|nr:hypothetical protein [Candidatus Diapherotrites archaeon]MBT7241757.1 hypothetical protein [Candidatus Diapherotrites archaeon]